MTELARWEFPMRLGRGGNTRLNPKTAARVAKRERAAAHWSALSAMPPSRWTGLAKLLVEHRFVVTIARCSPSHTAMDHDNVVASCKHIQDGIADRLGVDDGDRRLVRFEHAQLRAPWAVRIIVEIERRDA